MDICCPKYLITSVTCYKSSMVLHMVLIGASKGGQLCNHSYLPTNRHDPLMSNLKRSYIYIVSPTTNIREAVYLPPVFMINCDVQPSSAILGTLQCSNGRSQSQIDTNTGLN
jgi:hypothetical protein